MWDCSRGRAEVVLLSRREAGCGGLLSMLKRSGRDEMT